MKFSTSKQSGFTLVEIAIVLVIIGVLLAGVLKGQSLINNSRIKGLVGNINAISSGYNGYIDRYQVAPGTESVAATAARGWGPIAVGVSPLNAANLPLATTFASTVDQIPFFQSLGAAGFIAYTSTSTANPTSATGGLIGVTFSPYGMLGVSACLSALPPVLAEGVDVVVDGPISAITFVGNNVGSLRGAAAAAIPLNPGAGVPGAAPYNENAATFWTVCKTL